MEATATRHPYYSYDKICSYNATFNFLVGARGLGKTWGGKHRVIRDFIRKGDQFIYLRRYKSELQAARNTFFADIAHEFPDYDFRAAGSEAQISPITERDTKKRPWATMGYFIPLSTAQTQKSVAFPKVKTILFDEFIIETGNLHYLPEEWKIFNNFYFTVDRGLDKTKVYFLANSVSIMNPYFIQYEIRPDDNKEFVTRANGFMVCHFPDADDYASSIFETKFGKFIKGTEYADYAVGNKFNDNNDNLVTAKDPKARCLFTLETKVGTFSVWRNNFTDEWYIQEKLPKSAIEYTLLADRMTEEKTLVHVNDKLLGFVRTAFRQGRVWFDAPKTRNAFAEIFKR